MHRRHGRDVCASTSAGLPLHQQVGSASRLRAAGCSSQRLTGAGAAVAAQSALLLFERQRTYSHVYTSAKGSMRCSI